MDINLARQIISNAVKTREDEVLALKTAQDILEGTFVAEFANLTVAVNEANDFASKWNEEKTAHAATITSKDAEVVAKSLELDTATTHIAELESDKNSLTEILNLKVEEHAGIIAAKDLELATAKERITELETPIIKEPAPVGL